jgi:hypothetical protein
MPAIEKPVAKRGQLLSQGSTYGFTCLISDDEETLGPGHVHWKQPLVEKVNPCESMYDDSAAPPQLPVVSLPLKGAIVTPDN